MSVRDAELRHPCGRPAILSGAFRRRHARRRTLGGTLGSRPRSARRPDASAHARRDELEDGFDLLKGRLVEKPEDLDFICNPFGHMNNLNGEMSIRKQP